MSTIMQLPDGPGPIGIFDSGYGGLTIYSEIKKLMPEYDYLYLGDNARAPYGTRSFDVVYEFTRQAVEFLFKQGCQRTAIDVRGAARAVRDDHRDRMIRIFRMRNCAGQTHQANQNQCCQFFHTRVLLSFYL